MLTSGIDFSRIDSTIRPQDDFYRYVNGTWLKEFELPKDKSRYATFTVLREKAREDVKRIIEEASKTNSPKGTDNQKIGDGRPGKQSLRLREIYINESMKNALHAW